MSKYGNITDISLVIDKISIYRKSRYLKCRYDTDTNISISTIFSICRPTLLHIVGSEPERTRLIFGQN